MADRLARRRRILLRRLALLAVVLAGIGVAWYQVHQAMPAWYARLWYPLDYDRVVREEAARNQLDPALVAAVIYTESGFVPDSRSDQGAVGLMQVQPDTATFIAGEPDRPSPPPERISQPEVNIAYGARYLRYLIDRHGSVALALAAYNGGEGNLERWLNDARGRGTALRVPDDVPFSETRGFVSKVIDTAPIYRRTYDGRLGPPVAGAARAPSG